MKLNLGCGDDIREGYINVDLFNPKADEKVDLGQFNWPWPDESVDEILMLQTLEHLVDTERTIREIHRILKPGGIFVGQVPFGWADCGITEYGHTHIFHWNSFKSMERLGFKCLVAEPQVLRRGDKYWVPNCGLRNLVPRFIRKPLSHLLLNMFDLIDFKLMKL